VAEDQVEPLTGIPLPVPVAIRRLRPGVRSAFGFRDLLGQGSGRDVDRLGPGRKGVQVLGQGMHGHAGPDRERQFGRPGVGFGADRGRADQDAAVSVRDQLEPGRAVVVLGPRSAPAPTGRSWSRRTTN
jgi:hypothetical protein